VKHILIMRQLAVIALILSAVFTGVLQCAAEPVTIYGLAFPDRIGGASRGDVENFELANPGLGSRVRYHLPGWAIDIYIYDLKLTSIPDRADSEVIKAHLEQAKGDIVILGQRGTYRNVSFKTNYTIHDARNRPQLACASYTFIRSSNQNVDSFVCVTGWHNKFVKFRMTTLVHAASANESQSFLKAWVKVLWPGG